ncbi:arginase family protein [Kineococcus siccus]|uniref:arginase family protein n=1 Tax=Kineococcus siccus TaxID=2696567 RepID=UPI001413576C
MIAILAAPTNLGLRPPQPGSVPGCAKAPEALREAGLHRRLLTQGAEDAGVVLPGRYVADPATDDGLSGGGPFTGRLRNQDAILEHATRFAARLEHLLAAGRAPLVLGGDCSLLLGAGMALARRGSYGLIHVDGHTDFRHPGNNDACASLAGEDLAAAVGRHWPAVADPEGTGASFHAQHVAHLGCRDDDEHLSEARDTLGVVIPASRLRGGHGTSSVVAGATAALEVVGRARSGYWLHVDVDVLDPEHLPAVDSPDPGGLTPQELTELLVRLAPGAVGIQVTVFDPDLDPDGRCARLLADVLVTGLRQLASDC